MRYTIQMPWKFALTLIDEARESVTSNSTKACKAHAAATIIGIGRLAVETDASTFYCSKVMDYATEKVKEIMEM